MGLLIGTERRFVVKQNANGVPTMKQLGLLLSCNGWVVPQLQWLGCSPVAMVELFLSCSGWVVPQLQWLGCSSVAMVG